MEIPTVTNQIHHLAWHSGVELLDIQFAGHPFGKHSHDAYAIGVMESGVGGNLYRGERQILPENTLSLMNPDELHDGFSVTESLKYKMIYVSETSMRDILGGTDDHAFFEYTAPDINRTVATSLNEIHRRLQIKGHAGWKLAVDTALTQLLQHVTMRHSRVKLKRGGAEPGAVSQVRDYLESLTVRPSGDSGQHPGETVTLQALADLVGLNQNYLLNVFTHHVGVPPYMYWTTRRISVAKGMLSKGFRIASVAQELGFYDQAHFSRTFKKVTGITPGQFVAHR